MSLLAAWAINAQASIAMAPLRPKKVPNLTGQTSPAEIKIGRSCSFPSPVSENGRRRLER